jgi:hypothetical protein
LSNLQNAINRRNQQQREYKLQHQNQLHLQQSQRQRQMHPFKNIISSIKLSWIVLECHLLYNNSLLLLLLFGATTNANDMYLSYNGKVLYPYNTLMDYCNPVLRCSNSSISNRSISTNTNTNTNKNTNKDANVNTNDNRTHMIRNNEKLNSARCNMIRNDTPITIHASYPIKGGCFIISFAILMTIIFAICMSVCTCGISLVAIPLLAPFLFILPLFCL